MQVSIKTDRDGAMHLRLDEEAANAMLASVRFAARFHAGMAKLAQCAEESLAANVCLKTNDGRTELCH